MPRNCDKRRRLLNAREASADPDGSRVAIDRADGTRASRWRRRSDARVVTDLKVGAAFPTDHPLHVDAPAVVLLPTAGNAIAAADVILLARLGRSRGHAEDRLRR